MVAFNGQKGSLADLKTHIKACTTAGALGEAQEVELTFPAFLKRKHSAQAQKIYYSALQQQMMYNP